LPIFKLTLVQNISHIHGNFNLPPKTFEVDF
jgi:hypothetical protein